MPAHAALVRVQRGARVVDVIATELLPAGGGEHDREHRLPHHAGRRHGAGVRPLAQRLRGLVPGLGSHVSWEERLDGRIWLAMLSIQAVKGCGIGDGFDLAGRPGSAAHDEIFYSEERGYYRETNRSGGIEGGMTTGEPVVVRCAMKPLPTLTKPLRSVDIATREPAQALRERTDSCTVPAAGVVGEAMLAIVLADAYRAKFGGDHIDDTRAAVEAYCERIGWRR